MYPEEFCGNYIAEDGLHVVLVSIDGGIVLSVQPQSVDNLRKYVDEIVGKGELKNLSSSNVTVVELE
ncbi:MAG: hypothetical protein K5848_05240 [Lachnospiraceae bacterium]|nr:hypothetical protein [Lachnospiraceae bacterium]